MADGDMIRDSDDMIQAQIERRRRRGEEDLRRVVNRGQHAVYSTFEVTSVSGRVYAVQIHDLAARRNTCTCPDYRTNLIGTCKHIEGVLLELAKVHGTKLPKLAARRPAAACVFLHHDRDITVRVDRPLPESETERALLERYFDSEGVLQGPIRHTLPALLTEIDSLGARHSTTLEVAGAVRDHLALLRDRDSVRRQKAWFEREVAAGRRSLAVLSARLYPFQEQGALHLAFGRRSLLADDMGLGKTVQAIAAVSLLKQLRDIQRVLVVCPASLKHQWAREVHRFTGLESQVIGGWPDKRRQQYAKPAFFNIVNYEIVRRDVEPLQRLAPDVIILDEAQRIKNWRTKTADTVKQLESPYGFVLTGTPLENRLDELYSVFQFLDPRILGPLWQFNERYFELEETGRGNFKVLGYKNLDELRSRIAPYVMRRTRAAVLDDLPDRTDNNYFVEMTDEQWKPYEEFQATVASLLARACRRPLTPKEHKILLGALVKMRLICNALALHDKTLDERARERTAPKLREFRLILEDEVASNGHKALVFSQWTGMLELTEPILTRMGLGYEKLTGDVPTGRRGALIERFFEDADCRVFLSTDAGGTGLNLQAASLVINLDLPWNPAVLEQRIARAHRHGQARAVQVVNLIAQQTIEERMLDTLAAKRDVFQGVFGGEESPAAITFADTGQSLLRTLDELLGEPREVEVEIALAPASASERAAGERARDGTGERAAERARDGAGERAGERAAESAPESARPPLETFANLLVARLPGRVLLVRIAPQLPGGGDGPGVLVVVDREPAALRPEIETLLAEHWPAPPPALLLMEQEGYRALAALLSGTLAAAEPETEPYRAPALPADDPTRARRRRRQWADEGLAQAERRLRLAEVVLAGGFAEEAAEPLRAALGWGLSSLMVLADAEPDGGQSGERPSAALPHPRVVQARLVETGHLPAELAAQLAQVRELTAPADGDEATALSAGSAAGLLSAVRELVELARTRGVTSAVGG